MTDLMQTAVNTGTGRAAQIGRPVAGKTGTTTSNKDGWFIGFSSGITTGVWMGRDDNRTIPGLAGGRAPARAFASYMKVAVANRPVEQFETEVTLPEWQLEPDEEAYGQPDNGMMVDENGLPLPPQEEESTDDGSGATTPTDSSGTAEAPQRIDQRWIDDVLGRSPRQPAPAPARQQPGATPTPRPTPQQSRP
jgi:penicillin-binding protein 1A